VRPDRRPPGACDGVQRRNRCSVRSHRIVDHIDGRNIVPAEDLVNALNFTQMCHTLAMPIEGFRPIELFLSMNNRQQHRSSIGLEIDNACRLIHVGNLVRKISYIRARSAVTPCSINAKVCSNIAGPPP